MGLRNNMGMHNTTLVINTLRVYHYTLGLRDHTFKKYVTHYTFPGLLYV